MKKSIIVIITVLLSFLCATMLFAAPDTWTQKADFGGTERIYAVGFSIGDKGYIGTGTPMGYSGPWYKDFWEYDPVGNTWTQKADLGGAERQMPVGFSIGDKGYIGTGYDGSSYKDFWEYDPALNTWTQKADFGGTARCSAVGFSIGNKGYIGTGIDSASYTKDFWEYDPVGNTWTQKADFGGTARICAVGFSIGSKGYIGTGSTSSSQGNKDFWEYDPDANAWTQKADCGGSFRHISAGFSIGDKGYIGTGNGSDGGSYYSRKDFWEYDPAFNTWTQKTDFGGTARSYAVGFSIGDKGYIGTGNDGSSRKDFWEYEPIDTTPDQFTFIDQTVVPLSTLITSNTITVSGINTAATISIVGGQYAINGGDYTSDEGTVDNDDTVTVQQTSSADYSTTTDATLTIGEVSDTFSVTTAAPPVTVCVSTAEELQDALDDAQANGADDTIMVVQGTYTGNFSFNSTEGLNITLEGGYTTGCASREIDPANTILDGDNAGGVLVLDNADGGDILIEGFTIQNGNTTNYGGGVYAISYTNSDTAGDVTLANNIVTNNDAGPDGGGIFAESASNLGMSGTVTLFNNIVTGNTSATGNGGGVAAESFTTSGTAGIFIIFNNIIAGNHAGNNGGGAIVDSYASSGTSGNVTLTNNTITGNEAGQYGGGLTTSNYNNTINCYNNIIWGNTATDAGGDIYLFGNTGTTNDYNNDYTDNVGSWDTQVGHIDADPLFVGGGNYRLRSNSPCIDQGNNAAPSLPATDFEGDARIINGTVDMGADEARVLSPSGTSAALCPDGLGFGEVATSSTRNLNLIMNNTTDANIDVDPITVVPSPPYTKTADNCGGVTLHPGDTCSITIQFAPSSTGTFYGSFDITTDDPEAGTITVALSGIGVTGGSFETRSSSVSGPGAIPDVIVTGIGDTTPASPPVVEGPSSTSSNTGTTSAGELESPSVDTGTTNSSASSVVISSLRPDMPKEPEKQLLLAEELEPYDAMIFGEIQVGASDQLRITFSHEQGAVIHMGDIILPNAPYVIVEDKCSGALLGTGGECAVTVQFAPPTAENFYGYFLIPTDDPEVGTLRINLEGTGVSK
jgi:hypothetical protein